MSGWTLAWLVLGLAAGGIELAALLRRRAGDTLTEQIRALLRLGRVARAVLVLAWVWLGLHLFGPAGWV